MDKIKEKLASLRAEADANAERAEAAEAKNKTLEQEALQKDQQIASLNHKVQTLEADLDKIEAKVGDHKKAVEESETHKSASENLQRKIQLLEEELDHSEKNLKETTEKLRQIDVKAEHFERQVLRAEQERDSWEQKYEESQVNKVPGFQEGARRGRLPDGIAVKASQICAAPRQISTLRYIFGLYLHLQQYLLISRAGPVCSRSDCGALLRCYNERFECG
ncbi:hypothetical protein E5Q_05083 [Mixia osmundae IAM 14324]|uniref:Uncharacterized protein n=1 Tax=Mixia osmundae (strain CBS 9802 / IAM 14324 / JCM 22182 / KY 12970) TaxID=764103 RepID=G7E6D7_MIXOS|nr:hypothetical protein E5Q_05083 [Mixia osmundae IAM 14324]